MILSSFDAARQSTFPCLILSSSPRRQCGRKNNLQWLFTTTMHGLPSPMTDLVHRNWINTESQTFCRLRICLHPSFPCQLICIVEAPAFHTERRKTKRERGGLEVPGNTVMRGGAKYQRQQKAWYSFPFLSHGSHYLHICKRQFSWIWFLKLNQLLDDVTFLLATGLATFLPKLLQNQYSLTESQAKGSTCLQSWKTLLLPFVSIKKIRD